jgi:glycosyltransferase involved in cell wall biosynthesis
MYPPIVYLMNTEYPNSKAHSIQVTKILCCLSKYTDVIFICNKLSYKHNIYAEIKEKYNYDLQRVKFIEIPKKKLRGISFLFTLKKILSEMPSEFVFYTRSYGTAKRLSRTKFLHKKIVILESHKKNGYDKEDFVGESRYLNQRKLFETNNISKKTLKKIYKSVDGIIFTSEESQRIVTNDLHVQNTAFIWHPLAPGHVNREPSRSIVYCGSLAPDKLIGLLLDALAISPTGIIVDLIGGSEETIGWARREAEMRGVEGNVRFLDRIPHSALPDVLSRYRFGLSLMEGLKVADYVECGLIPVIPRLAMYTSIFTGDSAIFFEPDSPESLNSKLRELSHIPVDNFQHQQILDQFSFEKTAQAILDVIRKARLAH